jgi:hypothetical protein
MGRFATSSGLKEGEFANAVLGGLSRQPFGSGCVSGKQTRSQGDEEQEPGFSAKAWFRRLEKASVLVVASLGMGLDCSFAQAANYVTSLPGLINWWPAAGEFLRHLRERDAELGNLAATTNSSTLEVDFTINTRIENLGSETSGLLLLRLIARPGLSKTEQLTGPNEVLISKESWASFSVKILGPATTLRGNPERIQRDRYLYTNLSPGTT